MILLEVCSSERLNCGLFRRWWRGIRRNRDGTRQTFTDKFGEHDKREVFYECDSEAEKETFLAKAFCAIKNGIFELTELKRKGHISAISDEDLPEVADHMKAMMKILEKYKEK